VASGAPESAEPSALPAAGVPGAMLPGPPLPPEPGAMESGQPLPPEPASWLPGPPLPPEPGRWLPGPPLPPEPGAWLPGPPYPPDPRTRPAAKLPSATVLPRPGPVEAPRGPFEPARPASASNSAESARPGSPSNSAEPGRPVSVTGSVEPPDFEPPRELPAAATAKLDQIKDLYLTAEAIGEDALDQHFDKVSARQRELIREFFERTGEH
jgi:hypothetical protein